MLCKPVAPSTIPFEVTRHTAHGQKLSILPISRRQKLRPRLEPRPPLKDCDGGFFSLEVAAPHRAVSADVSVDGQPDAVAECTRPNVAPLSGLGLGGVAITNSTPAAETTEHVEQAVDAYNLF